MDQASMALSSSLSYLVLCYITVIQLVQKLFPTDRNMGGYVPKIPSSLLFEIHIHTFVNENRNLQ